MSINRNAQINISNLKLICIPRSHDIIITIVEHFEHPKIKLFYFKSDMCKQLKALLYEQLCLNL